MALPARMKLRMLTLDPMWKQSKIERLLPNLTMP
jgi:hypothetical protein